MSPVGQVRKQVQLKIPTFPMHGTPSYSTIRIQPFQNICTAESSAPYCQPVPPGGLARRPQRQAGGAASGAAQHSPPVSAIHKSSSIAWLTCSALSQVDVTPGARDFHGLGGQSFYVLQRCCQYESGHMLGFEIFALIWV